MLQLPTLKETLTFMLNCYPFTWIYFASFVILCLVIQSYVLLIFSPLVLWASQKYLELFENK